MSAWSVVVATAGLDAAARREAAALAQELSREQQRELQQVAREAAPELREAARAGAHARVTTQGFGPGAPPPPGAPTPAPKVTVSPDGKMTVVGPEGHTTIIEPDGRLTEIDAEGHVSQSSGAPSTDGRMPLEVKELTLALFFTTAFIAVGLPLARAFARRLDRQSAGVRTTALPPELGDRMDRIEQAVEAVAIEVERVSEGQRFTTKLLSEMRAPAALAVGERQS